MKKFVAVFASFVLAGSMALVAACNSGKPTDAKVNGNFAKEATAEELDVALSKIDTETAFGGTSAENPQFGFDVRAGFDVGMDLSATLAGMTIKMNAGAGLNAGYKLVLAPEADVLSAKGTGNLSMNAKLKTELPKEIKDTMSAEMLASLNTKETLKANVCNDHEYVYLDLLQAPEGMAAMKVKLGFEDLSDLFGGFGAVAASPFDMETEGGSAEGEVEEGGEEFGSDFTATIGQLLDMGARVYVDETAGLKLKISFSESFESIVRAALNEIVSGMDTNYESIFEGIVFTSTVLDFYLVFDENGLFKQFSVDTDIALSLDTSLITASGPVALKLNASVKGGIVVKAYTGSVELPADLDSYMDMSGSFGGDHGEDF